MKIDVPPAISADQSNFIEDSQVKKKFAVKIIGVNDEELMEVAYEEYKLLRSLDHPNIVKMHDAFFNKMKETMFYIHVNKKFTCCKL